MLKLLQKTKGLFFKWRLHLIFGFLEKPMSTFSNLIRLSAWVHRHRDLSLNDFYSPDRIGPKREELYSHIIDKEQLSKGGFSYLEFGVANGGSFRWWVEHIKSIDTGFYGFDTFTGLPEDWGHFKKGDMSNGNQPPVIENDQRHQFFQGLFQQTLPEFISSRKLDLKKKLVIHMDADLYSSTLYVLTSLAPFIKPGDVIIFDEFNVPNHEFLAFEAFINSYYFKYEVLGAVNNYYNLALKIK